MTPVSAITSATYGIAFHLQQLDEAAARIVDQPLGPKLASDIVQLKTSKHGVAINAAVLRTVDRLTGTLVDIIA